MLLLALLFPLLRGTCGGVEDEGLLRAEQVPVQVLEDVVLGPQLHHEVDRVHLAITSPLNLQVDVVEELSELAIRNIELVVPVNLLPLPAVVRVPHEAESVGDERAEKESKTEKQEDYQVDHVALASVAREEQCLVRDCLKVGERDEARIDDCENEEKHD